MFSHYLKDIYRLQKLGKTNGGSLISIDESDFVDVQGEKYWVIGAKNNVTKNIRLDIFKTRSEEDCKLFIYNHVKPKNTIITDGWPSYGFLDNNDDYIHETHLHGPNGNFGIGSHSTSHIEGVWGTLKQIIKKIYGKIPDDNFILFLREAEFRYILSKLEEKDKEEKIREAFKYLFDSANYELYDLEELLSNDNYDI